MDSSFLSYEIRFSYQFFLLCFCTNSAFVSVHDSFFLICRLQIRSKYQVRKHHPCKTVNSVARAIQVRRTTGPISCLTAEELLGSVQKRSWDLSMQHEVRCSFLSSLLQRPIVNCSCSPTILLNLISVESDTP